MAIEGDRRAIAKGLAAENGRMEGIPAAEIGPPGARAGVRAGRTDE